MAGNDHTEIDITGVASDDIGYTFAYYVKVLRSTDGGTNWSNPSTFRFPSTPVGLRAIGGLLYTGSYWNGVFVSDDRGINWRSFSDGLPGGSGVRSLADHGDGRLIAVVADQKGFGGVYRTTAAGDRWESNMVRMPTAVPFLSGVGAGGGGAGYTFGFGSLFRQATATVAWTAVTRPGGFDVLGVVPSALGGTLAGTAGGGVYHCEEDRGTWVRICDTRLAGLNVLSRATSPDAVVHAGTNAGVSSCTPDPAGTAPTVTAISAASGPTSGGTKVTITGTNFLAGATITLGGAAATAVVVLNGTTITATTSAHGAGTVTVVVTNPNMQTGTLPNGFTYRSSSDRVIIGLGP